LKEVFNKDNSLLIKYFAAATQKQLIGAKKDDTHTVQSKEGI
jgi:hypothetical protein